MSRHPDPFEWRGGHPALDFVNTLDERPMGTPIENLGSYGDLVKFAKLAGLIEPSTARRLRSVTGRHCTSIARRARELREHVFAILAATHAGKTTPRASLGAIGSHVRRAHAARALVATAAPTTIRHDWIVPTSPEIPLHACALAVESLLVAFDRSSIRKCGAADCDVYFIDTSKARRRQWCSMQNCGNREKQRRWRSGRKSASE